MKKINLRPIINYLVATPEVGTISSLSLLLGVDKNFFGRMRSGHQTGQKPEIKVRVIDALHRRTNDKKYLPLLDELYNLLPADRAEKIYIRNDQLESKWKARSSAPKPPTINQILMG